MSNNWRELLEKAGATDEFLLNRVNELIEAIDSGKFKLRNKERELQWLKNMREQLLHRIRQKEV